MSKEFFLVAIEKDIMNRIKSLAEEHDTTVEAMLTKIIHLRSIEIDKKMDYMLNRK